MLLSHEGGALDDLLSRAAGEVQSEVGKIKSDEANAQHAEEGLESAATKAREDITSGAAKLKGDIDVADAREQKALQDDDNS